MLKCYSEAANQPIIPIEHVEEIHYDSWLEASDSFTREWLKHTDFKVGREDIRLIPSQAGEITKVIVGVKDINDPWNFAELATTLPEAQYQFTSLPDPQLLTRAAVAWGLGAYQYQKYKKAKSRPAKLVISSQCDAPLIHHFVNASYLVRDLVNTPTEDMGPVQLSDSAKAVAEQFDADFKEVLGEDLLQQNFPAIHTVGRASESEPRLMDIHWGDASHPKCTLVGKGVCFDTGGLNIKSTAGMTLMKKDMGGAAHALGLAYLIMALNLPVRLRVLIPAVENSISSNAYRPGDVISTRKGKSVEVTNTDAEGRLILADAIALACEEDPELVIDFATLTGAARVALGTDIPVYFTNDEKVAASIDEASRSQDELVWRLPLFAPYRKMLDSRIANISNASSGGYGGAITAALFLQEFVKEKIPWVHFDLMAWNTRSKAGRPIGGEAMGLRTVLDFLVNFYKSE